MSSLLARLNSAAAVSGGWRRLWAMSCRVYRDEGLAALAGRVRRVLFGHSRALPASARQAVDVQPVPPETLEAVLSSLELSVNGTPNVSIVIPFLDELPVTVACLAALARNPQETVFEVILVDDGSQSESTAALARIPGITYLRNDENLGYLRACNRGAAAATGDFICFLNNDTQVQAGWLDALVRRIEADPQVGLVGAKLLFPSGELQEAGARLVSVDRAGGPMIVGDLIGLGESPFKPCYCFARRVEYCSGAAILVRAEAWRAAGGYDERYAPAYFEDVDLAYTLRDLGYEVWFEPSAGVVHHLSLSQGLQAESKTDLVERNSRRFLEKWGEAVVRNRRIRAVAFYLPQFHPIPENDVWWGPGFTEWRNVTRARPNFPGHVQPHQPAELGYYDLRLPETRMQQAQLARLHGVSAFCYYYYWFNGRKLLQRPLDEVLRSGQPNFPFCICWANENWTRTWDGRESEILVQQKHSAEDDLAFIRELAPVLRDPRYLRIDNRPVLIVYKTQLLPSPATTAAVWRDYCREAGVGDLYLVCVHNKPNPASDVDPVAIGFDAAIEFPPLSKGVYTDTPRPLLNPKFKGFCYDYKKTRDRILESEGHPYMFFRGVMPSWDNTARRQDSGHIFLGSTPADYGTWLEGACDWTDRLCFGDERLVFINAWNEWAEGNHLEPDLQHGRAYLEETARVLKPYLESKVEP